ncbi:MAG TPA: TIGR03621 family F420-dependent LLM class oxidoreductase [Ilumatobacteraceae bacterium]
MTVRVNVSAGFGEVESSGKGWLNLARECEAIGYEHLYVADHLGGTGTAPFTAMASAAAVTERLRVGTYVLNNDFRHPVMVANEAAAIADLSHGRITLGLGAGHMKSEYDAAGIMFDRAGVRVSRVTESAELIAALLSGEAVTHEGSHYSVHEHAIRAPGSSPVRLLIGGNGTRVLQAAGRIADVVGFTGFTPSADGSDSNISHFTEVGLAERITVARTGAGDRWPLPIDLLIQVVVITDRAEVEADRFATRFKLPIEVVTSSPFVLIGSAATVSNRLIELHERFGVTSVTVFGHRRGSDNVDHVMAPVIEQLS